MHKNIRVSLVCLMALLTTGVYGQMNVHTPFARYGIGYLEQQGTFRTRAMGGISSGIRDNMTLNYLTPASYSSIDTISYLFDFGLSYGVVGLKGDGMSFTSQDVNFTHLMMGFPIMKGWGVTAAILPFSNGSYNISFETPGTGVTGTTYQSHLGSGGYQRVLLGTGFKPLPYVSAGINLFYLFGEVSRVNDFAFTGDNNYFNTRKQSISSLKGLGYEASVQFMLPLSDNRYINAGLTWTPAYDLRTGNEDLTLRYSYVSFNSSLLARDTLSFGSESTTSRMPNSIRAGIGLGKTDKFTAGADIVYTKWTKASLPGTYGIYSDAMALHAGAEYVPDKYSNYGFFNRMEYRIGCRYGESYTLFEGDNLKEYGITFGTGIPMRRSRSRISLVVDLSTRGNGEGAVPGERRITVGASLNLHDYWFIKRQYD